LRIRKLAVMLTAVTLVVGLAAPVGAANPNAKADKHKVDNLPAPHAQKYQGVKAKAREMVAKGQAKATGKNKVVKVGKGQTVELAFEGEDKILTILGEFGTAPNNTHPNHPPHNGTPGPLHNAIPQPNRTVDNTTIWTADFNQAHYQQLLFDKGTRPSMANWYLAASDGRYSVTGYVSDWVQVPFNEAAYGSNYCGSNVCTRDTGRFIEDSVDTWWTRLVTEKGSVDAANAWLSQFDIWDRYDWDEDDNFNEPDGYIDHFQSVHAGQGEETGGGAQGTDAIWSHRSNVNSVLFGTDGPFVDGEQNKTGGAHIGASNYWIDDYTIEPENGGVGVFAHEFGHDLDLPDEYDTGGNTGFGENGTAWWTTWSQGSYGTVSNDLGSFPVHMTSWEKWFLGWLNYDVAHPGVKSSHRISALETNTKRAQALMVVLPDKETVQDVGTPWLGSNFYFSGSGNNLDNNMAKEFTLGAGPIEAKFSARYHIEPCWDYAYLQVSEDDGATWTSVHTSASDPAVLNVNGQNLFGEGISGVSGHAKACDDDLTKVPTPIDVTADLSAYANQTIQLRFRYWTDGAAVGNGFSVDNLTITGVTNPAVDDAEADYGWTYDGFVRTDGTIESLHFNMYLAEYRTYQGYDRALKLGPYNFVDQATAKFVTHFPYQDGLLVWYYDESQHDNNVSDHPGEGLILPIDASPAVMHWTGSGDVARPRLASYDATFGLGSTDAFTLQSTTLGTLTVPSHKAVRTFNDNLSYYVASDPADATSDWKAGWNSVKQPHTGTVIKVAGVSAQGSFMQLVVNP
jgi:immune inhibitor A